MGICRLLLPAHISILFVFIAIGCASVPSNISGAVAVARADGHYKASILVIKMKDSGQSLSVKRGDTLELELGRSSGTGYEWYLDQNYKEYFDLLKEDNEEASRQGFVGGPVITRWQLKAVREGNTELKLFLYRNWEGKEKAVSSFQVKVEIR